MRHCGICYMRSKYIKKSDIEHLRGNLGSKWIIFQLMLETGIRVGDAVRVRGTDITNEDGSFFLTMPAQKTGKLIHLPLSPELGVRLSQSGKSYFFASAKNNLKPISRQTVWRWLKTAAREAHVPIDGTSPHSFRKCFAVRLLHEDGLHAVQSALQHSNDSVTRLYAYSDTVMKSDSDEPIRWRDLELICEYILDRLRES